MADQQQHLLQQQQRKTEFLNFVQSKETVQNALNISLISLMHMVMIGFKTIYSAMKAAKQ